MTTNLSRDRQYQVAFISLAPFLLITFGLAWGIFALFILLPNPIVSIFSQITGKHPLFFLAVYAPAIAAFIIKAGRVNNVLVRIPGTASTGAIVLDGHYDAADTGPGASDCGSCVVTGLETLRAIRAVTFFQRFGLDNN